MDYYGQLFRKEGDPDNCGEEITFFHAKYPEWRVIIESRVPWRDHQGLSRGTQNIETALAINFRGKQFKTNSTRVIEALRGMREYNGKKGPQQLQGMLKNRSGGLFELDKIEAEIYLRQKELEAQVREEILARKAAEEEALRGPKDVAYAEDTSTADDEVEYVAAETSPKPQVISGGSRVGKTRTAGRFCPNCGEEVSGNFCSACGFALRKGIKAAKPKRTWTCSKCGQGGFVSGFKLAEHQKSDCPAVLKEFNLEPFQTGPEMTSGAGTENVGKVRGLL